MQQVVQQAMAGMSAPGDDGAHVPGATGDYPPHSPDRNGRVSGGSGRSVPGEGDEGWEQRVARAEERAVSVGWRVAKGWC